MSSDDMSNDEIDKEIERLRQEALRILAEAQQRVDEEARRLLEQVNKPDEQQ